MNIKNVVFNHITNKKKVYYLPRGQEIDHLIGYELVDQKFEARRDGNQLVIKNNVRTLLTITRTV